MWKKSSLFLTFTMLLLTLIFTRAFPVYAADNDFTFTPLTLDDQHITKEVVLPADGKLHQLTLSLTNFSQYSKNLQLIGSDPVTDASGNLVYQAHSPRVSTTSFKFSDTISKQNVAIAAAKTATVKTTIQTPKDVMGNLMGALQLMDGKKNVALVFLRIEGTRAPTPLKQVKVANFFAKNISEMPALMLRFQNENGELLHADFNLKLTYEGFLHLNQRVWQIKQKQIAIASYSTFDKAISLQGAAVQSGRYQLSGEISVNNQKIKVKQYLNLSKKEANQINKTAKVAYKDYHIWLIGLVILLGLILLGVIYLALYQAKKQKNSAT